MHPSNSSEQARKVGIIIGRFQTHELHDGHRYLIQHVINESDEVLILIGNTKGQPTEKDPLDFETRRDMILEDYPDVAIDSIDDHYSDETWSQTVDSLVSGRYPDEDVTLYGSRDSFIPYYFGKYECVKVPEIPAPSGTEQRNRVTLPNPSTSSGQESAHFRAGMIHAQNNRYPIMYQVVDVCIVNQAGDHVLLGRRESDDGKWRFIGGFVDPRDKTLEEAVAREVKEETNVEVEQPRYVASFRTNDIRYRGSEDYIMTALFIATYKSGEPKGDDDIDEVKWFKKEEVLENLFSDHKEMGKLFLSHI